MIEMLIDFFNEIWENMNSQHELNIEFWHEGGFWRKKRKKRTLKYDTFDSSRVETGRVRMNKKNKFEDTIFL